MKNIKKYLQVLALVFVLGACTSDDNSTNNSNDLNAQIQEITDIALSGTWIVTSFIDSGVDETDDFAGYSFAFNADGSLVADNGTNTVEGSWSVTGDDSDDSMDDSPDDDSDDIDFNIFFASPDNFNELTEDWEIVSQSSTKIDLIHVSGGDGSTDTLKFEKN